MKTVIVFCTIYLAEVLLVGLHIKVEELTGVSIGLAVLLIYAIVSDVIMFKMRLEE